MDLNSIPGYLCSKLTFNGMVKQGITGFPFDVHKAMSLCAHIREEMKKIEEDVEPRLPPRPLKKGEEKDYTFPARPFKMDGTLSAHGKSFLEKHGLFLIGLDHVQWRDGAEDKLVKIEGGKLLPATAKMQLSEESTPLKDWFISLGWIPTIWNFKKDERGKVMRDDKGQPIRTSPKIHEKGEVCPNLMDLPGDMGAMVKEIATYFSLKHRFGTINSWLNNERLPIDGCLTAGSSGITNTHRQKHTVVCNVPKAEEGVLLGKEMRSLFIPFEGHVQVGFDAAALENRVEAHYCYSMKGGEAYAEEVLNGDPHTKNAFVFYPSKLESLSLRFGSTSKDDPRFKPFRSRSKNGKYCLSYGGRGPKLAATLGLPEAMGESLYDAFWDANEPLKLLKERLERFWETTGEKKWIKGIDGRKLYSRSKHSLVNLLFQSCGAITMEYAFLFIEKWLGGIQEDSCKRPCFLYKGHVIYRLGFFHDEGQFSCPPEIADELGSLCCRAVVQAGRYLKLKVPMAGEYVVGKDWSQCH